MSTEEKTASFRFQAIQNKLIFKINNLFQETVGYTISCIGNHKDVRNHDWLCFRVMSPLLKIMGEFMGMMYLILQNIKSLLHLA